MDRKEIQGSIVFRSAGAISDTYRGLSNLPVWERKKARPQRRVWALENSAEPVGFCGRVCTAENLLKTPHTEPERFCRTLGAKPSFSDPTNSCPTFNTHQKPPCSSKHKTLAPAPRLALCSVHALERSLKLRKSTPWNLPPILIRPGLRKKVRFGKRRAGSFAVARVALLFALAARLIL